MMKKLFVAILFGLFLSTSVNAGEEPKYINFDKQEMFYNNPGLEAALTGQVKYGIKLDEAPALIDCFRTELAKYLMVSVITNSDFNSILAIWLHSEEAQTYNALKAVEFLNSLEPFPNKPCYLAFRYYNAEERTIISND